ncbi:hypothetical protein P8452_69959 [Trifolium repens]|nr:hypothetical protein P8452_69959 [Trifolium repens]
MEEVEETTFIVVSLVTIIRCNVVQRRDKRRSANWERDTPGYAAVDDAEIVRSAIESHQNTQVTPIQFNLIPRFHVTI